MRGRSLFRCVGIVGFALVLGGSLVAQESIVESQAFSVETGVLWGVGSNTPLAYRLVPTQISWRSGEFLGRDLAYGSRLVVRHRLSLLATWVPSGPESRFIGVGGSPSIELWNRGRTSAIFGGAGGGVGWIDSRGVAGGQGQDFTLNWFARFGLEHATRRNFRATAAVMFQHMSNGGRTEPNPGIDALGLMVGVTWSR